MCREHQQINRMELAGKTLKVVMTWERQTVHLVVKQHPETHFTNRMYILIFLAQVRLETEVLRTSKHLKSNPTGGSNS